MMSSTHLRHCPKHRLKLPCPHCAMIAVSAEPAPLTTVAERAKRWREKQKRDNPNFAKQEAERKAGERVEVRRVAEIERITRSNPQPLFVMTDAPEGKGLLLQLSTENGEKKSGKVKPTGFGAASFEKNDGMEVGVKNIAKKSSLFEGVKQTKIATETASTFGPNFPPDKERKILRQFVCDNTYKNRAGEYMCTLCNQVIGGAVRADFTDRLQMGLLHIEQNHVEQFQVFLARLANPNACHEDHEGMVRRHGGRNIKVQCGKCRKILWKPPKAKKPKKPRSDSDSSAISENAHESTLVLSTRYGRFSLPVHADSS